MARGFKTDNALFQTWYPLTPPFFQPILTNRRENLYRGRSATSEKLEKPVWRPKGRQGGEWERECATLVEGRGEKPFPSGVYIE